MERRSFEIGLVAEGPTDLHFLKRSIEKTLADQRVRGDVNVRFLQPPLDATSGTYGDGGWTLVRQWCRTHPPAARRSGLFQPLFAGQAPLDALVVHLDGDVLDEYAHHVKAPLPEKPWTPEMRADFVRAALREWLWPDGEADEDDHLLAIMVQALESWLLAAYDQTLETPEAVDPEPALRTASPYLKKAQTPGARLKKFPPTWEKMSRDAMPHLAHIRSVCPSSERFFSAVETLPLER